MSVDAASARAPDLVALRRGAEALAARLPGLLVEAERVAATVAQGVHGRRRTGVGETFWQFRVYQPGDDRRDIDWRQSARSRHLFVREQEWEAAQSVWIWCDTSLSMRFRSARDLPSKLERALVLALALAALLVRGGERVALVGSGERPRPGRSGLERLMRSLEPALARRESLPPPADLPRFAQLVLLSDFLEPPEALSARIAPWVAAGVRGCLLAIADPAEELLPWNGRVLFEGPEGEGRALVGNVAAVRTRYAELYRAHREEIERRVVRQNWRITRHRTDSTAETALLALYQLLAPEAVR
ncbi:MAG: DUF58 domain-containing protein [Geminicoccaceae bacterium]|nr:DUF58 domain-containing protein [Geminicoccaceae bacterium]MCS7269181.1 DUF58 domain-containing protein [Geminicoccaceae bacterium]MCX7629835.1 DUF58 domain-containing protein [Geminicoccaceae bacterium]MDW8125736.1 DUF58 domain-containing protein [Geminicoccaceae bacterium]MDW8340753.1 DUF58 domain-containing protein [Geminicoccaceae bacterium]